MSSSLVDSVQRTSTSALDRVTTFFRSTAAQIHAYEPIPQYGATSFSTNPALPPDATKIEPKVWFASERTFLTWLRVAVVISTFALALFNSAGDGDWVAKGMGIVYAGLAIAILGYAYAMHGRRRKRIMGRYAGHHDEIYGPVLLCIAIFLAVLVNFILRVNQRERLAHTPTPKNPWLTTVNMLQLAFTLPSK